MGLCCPHGGERRSSFFFLSRSSGSLHLWASDGRRRHAHLGLGRGVRRGRRCRRPRPFLAGRRREGRDEEHQEEQIERRRSRLLGLLLVRLRRWMRLGREGASASASSTLLLAAGDHPGRLALFPLGPPATRGGPPTFLGPPSPMTVPAGSNPDREALQGPLRDRAGASRRPRRAGERWRREGRTGSWWCGLPLAAVGGGNGGGGGGGASGAEERRRRWTTPLRGTFPGSR